MSGTLRYPYQVGPLVAPVVPMACDSANVLEGAALVMGAADNSCALPAAAEASKFLGLALFAGPATTGATLQVITGGFFLAIASGTITRGDTCVIADATGKVKTATQTTANGASVVGIAMESATDGSRFMLRLGGHLIASPSAIVQTFVAGTGGATANTVVVQDTTTDGQVVAPAGADPTSGVVGVALNTALAGATVYVVTFGAAQVTAGAGITRGNLLAVAGVSGKAKPWAPAAGTNSMVVGYATASISNNATGALIVNPHLAQG